MRTDGQLLKLMAEARGEGAIEKVAFQAPNAMNQQSSPCSLVGHHHFALMHLSIHALLSALLHEHVKVRGVRLSRCIFHFLFTSDDKDKIQVSNMGDYSNRMLDSAALKSHVMFLLLLLLFCPPELSDRCLPDVVLYRYFVRRIESG